MNMIEAVKSVLSQYVGFRGRARRSEYWYWILATTLASLVIVFVENAIGIGYDGSGPISSIFSLALFLPWLAVTFRRLHDTGRSGWWIGGFYLSLIAFVIIAVVMALGIESSTTGTDSGVAALGFGVIFYLFGLAIYAVVMLIFLCQDSKPGPNQYGPNPKDIGNFDIFE